MYTFGGRWFRTSVVALVALSPYGLELLPAHQEYLLPYGPRWQPSHLLYRYQSRRRDEEEKGKGIPICFEKVPGSQHVTLLLLVCLPELSHMSMSIYKRR